MPQDTSSGRLPRRAFLGATSASLALSLAGCLGGDDDIDADGGGNGTDGGGGGGDSYLHVTQQVSPLEWDPIWINDVYSTQIANLIYDGLYEYGEGLDLVPKIAADMPEVENDGTRVIIPLREEATFQNGNPVTAEDVAYTFLGPVEDQTPNIAEVDMIESAEAVDEQTVQFDLEYPYGPFTTATIARLIVPMDVREDDPEAFNNDSPVGSGPYEFVDWTEGDYVDVQRWDDYWDDTAPTIEEIRFEPVEEDTTRIAQIETEQSDVVLGIPAQNYEGVQQIQHARIEEAQSISYFYLAFNCQEGPTADVRVRQAVDHAISMSSFVEQQVEPAGTRQVSPIPAAIAEEWEFPVDEWAGMELEQDRDRAQELLDEAAPSDWSPTIIVPPDDIRERLGEVIASALNDLGYDARVQRLDWGPFTETYQSGDSDEFQMYALGWSGAGDPDAFMFHLFHESVAGEGGTQGHFYDNQEVHDQIMGARQSVDRDERRELYVSAINQLLEDKVHLPAYSMLNSMAINERVQDLPAHPVSSNNPRIVSSYNNAQL
ncbi:ABC transporter substrate-binding protein [Haloferacaceae archaeon DSL9]